AQLPPVSVQRSAPVAERARVQPGESVAEAGAAEADRELVVDELAATVGEDRRQADQACAVLLAAAGGEPSEAAPVRGAWCTESQRCRCPPDRLRPGSKPGEGREWTDTCLRNCLK